MIPDEGSNFSPYRLWVSQNSLFRVTSRLANIDQENMIKLKNE